MDDFSTGGGIFVVVGALFASFYLGKTVKDVKVLQKVTI